MDEGETMAVRAGVMKEKLFGKLGLAKPVFAGRIERWWQARKERKTAMPNLQIEGKELCEQFYPLFERASAAVIDGDKARAGDALQGFEALEKKLLEIARRERKINLQDRNVEQALADIREQIAQAGNFLRGVKRDERWD